MPPFASVRSVRRVSTNEAGRQPSRYLVEVAPPDGGQIDVGDLASRARAACEALPREGVPVRLLRSVFVPEDGSCLLVFEASDADAVRSAIERAGVPVERVSEAIRAKAGGVSRRPNET